MLYDLNLAWTPSITRDDIDRLLSFSASLGYNVVALNHTISTPLPSQPQNPIPTITPSPSVAASACSASSSSSKPSSPITVLRRATIVLADPSVNFRIPSLVPLYDIIAVRPTTADAFQKACLDLPSIALISLDMASSLGFAIKPRLAMAAVARGVRFEISYASVLASGADARARANFIANAATMVRATRGRGLIVSSGASRAFGLRAPADVANLMAVWELSQEQGTKALGVVPRGVVMNEGILRRGFRGVVDVVQTAAGREEDGIKASRNGEGEGKGGGGGGGGGEAQAGVETKGKQKRKNGDDADGRGDPMDSVAGVSKRQAKKLRKENNMETGKQQVTG